jgi:hypothetical protein
VTRSLASRLSVLERKREAAEVAAKVLHLFSDDPDPPPGPGNCPRLVLRLGWITRAEAEGRGWA